MLLLCSHNFKRREGWEWVGGCGLTKAELCHLMKSVPFNSARPAHTVRGAFKRWAWPRYYDPPLSITADSAVLPIKYSALAGSWRNGVLPESQGCQVLNRAGPKQRNPYSNLVHRLLAGFLASFPFKRNRSVWLDILVFLWGGDPTFTHSGS